MNSKDGIDFAMLITLRESRRTSDPALSRVPGGQEYLDLALEAMK
ncbi:MAG: hypothetical protein P8Y74_09235 [Desulfobacterales bacterium]